MPKAAPVPHFEIAGHFIAPGTTETIDIPVSRLPTDTEVSLRVRVIHGKKPGPVMFVSGSVHGDEIIGVEVVRRLLKSVSANRLAGTLLCIPIVNAYGFVAHQRYLPDRRDLNRCFPGNSTGSLASQLAHCFTTEIIARSNIGVDIHTAGLHRENLPQVRISDNRPVAEELAPIFGAPAVIVSKLREGSLRQTAADHDCDVLLVEAGEALRFDELSIRVAVQGILRVMHHLDMGVKLPRKAGAKSVRSRRSTWVRAPLGGLFRATKPSGALVTEGEAVGYLTDPFGDNDIAVPSPICGIIIGRSNLPVVNQGDALVHVAEVEIPGTAEDRLSNIEEAVFADGLFDEDEIV
ncbi:succinylglutamate desuccinylase/aspartoacylase family protein [Altererythrobacter sp. RZ02]|uniref:Succinylglutamate desuccinylase/aspartoacylase family protein n=1 Tax=Pontixanthobacter rizhaonensis TaxID=2730337 RepID=A0A848QSG9_9SPHN|nr:succinylglutamate desuccinylase/aspartoacylase family protein [Pontixanthobacter rizhaonensis]